MKMNGSTSIRPLKPRQAGPDFTPQKCHSTNHKQTYYLTLDLPAQEFSKRKDLIVANNRGGYNVWFNPNFAGPGGEDEHGGLDDELGPTASTGRLSPEAQQQPGHPDESQAPRDPSKTEPEEIQILELHSERPLVSHRGSIFQGSWAENIGTELVFASRDSPDSLPVLRHLPDGLDLLAASSARINFSPVELKQQRTRQLLPKAEIELDRYRVNGGAYIHVHSDKYGIRRPQANFLEDLTAAKRRRGERDQVTVTTMDTPHNQLLETDPDEEAYRNRLERHRIRNQRTKEARDAELGRHDEAYKRTRHRWGEADDIFIPSKWEEEVTEAPETQGGGDEGAEPDV